MSVISDTSVIIPFGSKNADRIRVAAYVHDYYKNIFSDWNVLFQVSKVQPFPRAKVVNDAVKMVDSPLLLLVDADSLCPPEEIQEALEMAQEAPGLVYCYTYYQQLDRIPTEYCLLHANDLLKAFEDWPIKLEIPGASSTGCVAISREAFLEVGGYDEFFTQWAPDDLDLRERCSELWPERRVPGILRHLWHGYRQKHDVPMDADFRNVKANYEYLYKKQTERYKKQMQK